MDAMPFCKFDAETSRDWMSAHEVSMFQKNISLHFTQQAQEAVT